MDINEASIALAEIIDYYGLLSTEIEVFSPVAYPIAIVEVDMMEESKEDFNAIHRAVLEMISLGFNDAKKISALMGLTETYSQQIIQVLLTYEHIDENLQITELGQKSLRSEGKMYLQANNVKRDFYVDALNCAIIHLTDNFDRKNWISSRDMFINQMPWIKPEDGIDRDTVNETLRERHGAIFETPDNIETINVRCVNKIDVLEVKNTKGYLAKFRDHEPMVFVKRFARNSANPYYWQPFSVNNESDRKYLGLPALPKHNEPVQERIEQAYRMITRDGLSADTVSQYVSDKWGVSVDGVERRAYAVEVTRGAIQRRHDSNFFQALYHLGKGKPYVLVADQLRGNVVSVTFADDDQLGREALEIALKVDRLSSFSIRRIIIEIDEFVNREMEHGRTVPSSIELYNTVLDDLLSRNDSSSRR